MNDEDSKLFVLDEVGIGTKLLRRYAYSHIGKPAVLEKGKTLSSNLTSTVTISEKCVEAV